MTKNLTSLFTNGAISVLHIDLEPTYRDRRTENAFQNAARLAASLRERKVENLWIFSPNGHSGDMPRKMTYAQAKTITASDVFAVAFPTDQELVFPKYERSATENPELTAHFAAQAAPVIIADGVYATSCYLKSVVGILKSIPHVHVVMALDAVDVRSSQQIFLTELTAYLNKQQRDRLHVSNVTEILEALPT